MKKFVLFFMLILFSGRFLIAQNAVVKLIPFSSGYYKPLDIENCGDSRMFIVQQNGYIYICDSLGNKNPIPFLDVHARINNLNTERGLLGLAFHPDYIHNGFFFIYYTEKDSGALRISRFKTNPVNPALADSNSEQIVLQIPHFDFTNHNGGCLKFDHEGYLYAGTGDGGSGGDPMNHAQNKKNLLGKILRIDVDHGLPYSIPPDNPFVHDTSSLPEVWDYGVRNPWRYSFDRLSYDLWIGDVGQDKWEEVDYESANSGGGKNYGWRCYEGNHEYNTSLCNGISDFTFPVYEYPHTPNPDKDCTVTGGFIYRGAQFGNLFGSYIFADYCSGKFHTLTSDGKGGWIEHLVTDDSSFNYDTFGENRWGELYTAGITNGTIFQVTDTSCLPTAFIIEHFADSLTCVGTTLHAVYGNGLDYQWKLNGVDIAAATTNVLLADSDGNYTVQVTNDHGCSNLSAPVNVGQHVKFSGLDTFYCTYQSPVLLTGNPPGGTFSGKGVSGNYFAPNVAGPGIFTIYYGLTNGSGCHAVDSQKVVVGECTGLNNDWENSGINIFPNPGNGMFTIQLKSSNIQIDDVSIWNVSGQLMMKLNQHPVTSKTIILNATALQDGIYFLKLINGNTILWHTLVIRK